MVGCKAKDIQTLYDKQVEEAEEEYYNEDCSSELDNLLKEWEV